jgi:hypothetical protein
MRLLLSRIQKLVMARSHMVSATMIIIATCAIVTGTILINNSLHLYLQPDSSLVLGSAEIVFGVVVVGQACRLAGAPSFLSLLTKKRVVIAVSTVVMLSICWVIKERSSTFRETALSHYEDEQSYLNKLTAIKKGELTKICITQDDGTQSLYSADGLVPLYQRLVAYHIAMKIKHEHAYECPWLPIEPDPPEPK